MQLHETYLTEAWFEVENERKYYVTVAAYNHALDHSEPVCSDGVVIDTSIPSISELHVAGARVDPQLLRDKDENIWFLHDDRTRQRVENVSYTCRLVKSDRTFNVSANKLNISDLDTTTCRKCFSCLQIIV